MSPNYPEVARHHVHLFIHDTMGDTISKDEIYVVWFCYILGGWKALVSTERNDGLYYEVTFNKEKNETYIDTYQKLHNQVYSHGREI